MKINEKIEEMQSKLIKALTEANPHNKEEAVRLLEEIGLDNEFATKLLEAYRDAESAKNTSKNVWDSAWESKSGIDYSTDVAKYQQQEFDTRQHFDAVNAECALLLVAKRIEPGKINDEILSKLYEQGVQENQIDNLALRITFHYYSESRAKDVQRSSDMDKIRGFSSRIGNQMTSLKNQLQEAESENAALKSSNSSLKSSYEDLQRKFNTRIASDEKHYQVALSQIATLKKKLRKLQNKSVFQVVGDRLKEVFGNKTKELPEPTSEIPETLYESVAEKIGIEGLQEEVKLTSDLSQTQTADRTTNYDEWQQ